MMLDCGEARHEREGGRGEFLVLLKGGRKRRVFSPVSPCLCVCTSHIIVCGQCLFHDSYALTRLLRYIFGWIPGFLWFRIGNILIHIVLWQAHSWTMEVSSYYISCVVSVYI